MESGAYVLARFHPYASTMTLDHTAHVCEANSRSREILDAMQPLEHAE